MYSDKVGKKRIRVLSAYLLRVSATFYRGENEATENSQFRIH